MPSHTEAEKAKNKTKAKSSKARAKRKVASANGMAKFIKPRKKGKASAKKRTT